MIRILMNIKNFSPFLSTVSGEIIIEHVDFRELDSASQIKPVLDCNFSCKPGAKGYNNIKGVNHKLFEVLQSQIDVMIESYTRGMTLAPHNFSWIEDSVNKSLDVWLKEKGVSL